MVLSGWGTAETHLGAWAEKSRVPGKWLIPLTKGLTAMQAVTLGTAGNAAALCDLALQNAGFEIFRRDIPPCCLIRICRLLPVAKKHDLSYPRYGR